MDDKVKIIEKIAWLDFECVKGGVDMLRMIVKDYFRIFYALVSFFIYSVNNDISEEGIAYEI